MSNMSQVVLAADVSVPKLDYAAMAPILILFGAACIGVLIEAFASRRTRHLAQVVLSAAALIAALVTVIRYANSGRRELTADVALAVDGRPCSCRARWPSWVSLAVLLMAERTIEPGGPFVAQAAITVGSEADRRQARAARWDRGLPADPVRAGRHDDVRLGQRPADHVRGARGLLAAAVPALRPGPPAPAGEPGGGPEVLPARSVRVGVLPVRHGPAVRVRGHRDVRRHPRRGDAGRHDQ